MTRAKHDYEIPMPEHLKRTCHAWRGMHNRCGNPNAKAYPRYGGRGITVCAEWASFRKFLADMGEKPEGCSLDRKNNDKGYSKANCRWATDIEQNRNRGQFNRLLRYKGVQKCAAAWASAAGISRELFHWRLQNGWGMGQALQPPGATEAACRAN